MKRSFTLRQILTMTAFFGLSFGCLRSFLARPMPANGLGIAWGIAASAFFGAAVGMPFRRPFWSALIFLCLFVAYAAFPIMTTLRE
jgi:hypothetical protein